MGTFRNLIIGALNHNPKEIIDHILMIMTLTMTMLLFFVVRMRKHHNVITTQRRYERHDGTTGSLCFGQLKSRSSAFELVHFKMAASFEGKLSASAVEFLE